MRIAIGNDHRGFKLKQALVEYLKKNGQAVEDFGGFSEESCDYPEFAIKVAKSVAKKKNEKGILICNSGIGMAMAASTIKGIRAANCFNLATARFSREHNDANVLVLAAAYLKTSMAKRIVSIWLKTDFAGGRHLSRVKMFSK
ncbi:MAG: ribose 5-phosphate isomerase B [Candidatus Omnitrophica bacterium]|nr:ribose 5-phosphate isomerase B [Candidatus Omnitrophota bacterium]